MTEIETEGEIMVVHVVVQEDLILVHVHVQEIEIDHVIEGGEGMILGLGLDLGHVDEGDNTINCMFIHDHHNIIHLINHHVIMISMTGHSLRNCTCLRA